MIQRVLENVLQSELIQQEELTFMNKNDLKSTCRTNWKVLELRSDEDIDYSDIPPLTDEFFERATLRIPADQARKLVQLDPDVEQWFQSQGEQYTAFSTSIWDKMGTVSKVG